MADSKLNTVKSMLGVTGNALDETLTAYIEEVKAYMLDAGVRQSIIDSARSTGCIARGVSDLWSYESGTTELSDYFKMRVIQLSAGDSDV